LTNRTKDLKRTQGTMQAVRETALPQVWYSPEIARDADGDCLTLQEAHAKESLW